MLEYFGWQEAADLIYNGLEAAIASKRVTYDFERLMDDGLWTLGRHLKVLWQVLACVYAWVNKALDR